MSYINLVFNISLCKLEPKLHKKEWGGLFFLGVPTPVLLRIMLKVGKMVKNDGKSTAPCPEIFRKTPTLIQ